MIIWRAAATEQQSDRGMDGIVACMRYSCRLEELDLEVRGELLGLAHETKKGDMVVGVDEYLEYVLAKWCDMAEAQKEQLLVLFGTFDDGDGQLSLSEFTHVVEAATPGMASQTEVLELYKRCLARSAELAEAEKAPSPKPAAAAASTSAPSHGGDGEDSEDDAMADGNMDAIKPDAFLAVLLPHLLQTIQQTL